GLAEVQEHGQRLEHRLTVDHHRRHLAVRVEPEELRLALLALGEVQLDLVVRHAELLERPMHARGARHRRVVEDDAHALPPGWVIYVTRTGARAAATITVHPHSLAVQSIA